MARSREKRERGGIEGDDVDEGILYFSKNVGWKAEGGEIVGCVEEGRGGGE